MYDQMLRFLSKQVDNNGFTKYRPWVAYQLEVSIRRFLQQEINDT